KKVDRTVHDKASRSTIKVDPSGKAHVMSRAPSNDNAADNSGAAAPVDTETADASVQGGTGAGVGSNDPTGSDFFNTGADEEGVGGRVAASKAFICASLSLPASIIPDNVPVRNVAIGIISSKNF
ncbi:MAG: hypothetical protein ACO3IA_06400, partial [Candidatus Nanopelagicales bacterium]